MLPYTRLLVLAKYKPKESHFLGPTEYWRHKLVNTATIFHAQNFVLAYFSVQRILCALSPPPWRILFFFYKAIKSTFMSWQNVSRLYKAYSECDNKIDISCSCGEKIDIIQTIHFRISLVNVNSKLDWIGQEKYSENIASYHILIITENNCHFFSYSDAVAISMLTYHKPATISKIQQ